MRLLSAAVLAIAVLSGCSYQPLAPSVPPYDSRTLEYHPYGSDGSVDANPAINIVYDAKGKAAGRFEMTYDGEGNATRTDLYQYDEQGVTSSLLGHYTYTYETPAIPTSPSPFGDPTPTEMPERIIKGEAFDANGALQEYYVVTYATGAWLEYDYTAITDYDGHGVPTANHTVTYITDTDNPASGRYRTEQYFSYDSTGKPKLQKEYAAYYLAPDAQKKVREQAELYHVMRDAGSQTELPGTVEQVAMPAGTNELYFFTQFSYDAQGHIYLQSDALYSDADSLQKDGVFGAKYYDPSTGAYKLGAWSQSFGSGAGYTDPFDYPIDPTYIGNQVDLMLSAYDGYGNLVEKLLYEYGVLQQKRTYTWNDGNHITAKNLYVNGASTLQQKDVTSYYDVTLSGVKYQVWDSTTYYFSPAATKNVVDRSIPSPAHDVRSDQTDFNPAGLNSADLLAELGRRMFHEKATAHE